MTGFWLAYIGANGYILLCAWHEHRDEKRRPR